MNPYKDFPDQNLSDDQIFKMYQNNTEPNDDFFQRSDLTIQETNFLSFSLNYENSAVNFPYAYLFKLYYMLYICDLKLKNGVESSIIPTSFYYRKIACLYSSRMTYLNVGELGLKKYIDTLHGFINGFIK